MAYQPEIEKLKQRYEADPSRNFAQLAEAYRREGRLDEALEILRLHLEERPSYVSGLIVLGRCLVDQHSDAEARDTFERVLSVDAEHIIALKSLADIAERAGDVAGAKSWLQRLLEVDPMNDEAQEALDRLATAPAQLAPAAPVEKAPREEERPATEPVAPAEPAPEPHVARVEPAAEPEVEAEPAVASAASDEADQADAPSPTVIEMAAVTPEPPGLPEKGLAAPAEDEPPAVPEDLVIERASAEYQGFPAEIEPVQVERSAEADLPPLPPKEESDEERPVALDEEPTVEMPPPDVGLSLDEAAAALEATTADAPPTDLEMQAFDTDLGWGTGERISRQITPEDLAQAEQAHEDAIEAAAAQELPGLENAEVPDLHAVVEPAEGLEPAEVDAPFEPVAPVEGLTVADTSVPAPEPLEGLEPTASGLASEPFTASPGAEEPTEEASVGGDTVLEQPAITESDLREPVEQPVSGDVEEARLAPEEPEPTPAVSSEAGPEVAAEASAPDGDEVEEDEDSLAGLPVFLPAEGASDESGAPIVTETMAEVYVKQGLVADAREIYRQLLAQRPDDARLRARLAELEEAPRTSVSDADVRPTYAASVTGGESARSLLKRVLQRSPDTAGETESATADVLSDASSEAEGPSEAPVTSTPMDQAFGPEDADDVEPEEANSGPPAEPPGAPTVPASDEVSLASVFGDAPPPKAPEPTSGRGPDEREPTGGFSFDEFFGQTGERPSGETRKRDSLADDEGDEAFKSWLKGLKS